MAATLSATAVVTAGCGSDEPPLAAQIASDATLAGATASLVGDRSEDDALFAVAAVIPAALTDMAVLDPDAYAAKHARSATDQAAVIGT